MASDLERAIARYRRQLLAGEVAAQQVLATAYADVRRRLVAEIDGLVKALAGQTTITPVAAARLDRAAALLDAVEDELTKLGRLAEPLITAQQRRAVAIARQRALDLAILSAPDQAEALRQAWHALNADATVAMIGRLQDGQSLDQYFKTFANGSRAAMEQALTTGVALGEGPIALARRLTVQTNLPYQRLVTVTRNEILGAFRSASLAHYAENADILRGWVWLASLSDRTCPACLALHGREFKLSRTFMPTHSRCRCSPAPLVKDAANPFAGEGERWFAARDAETRARILRVNGGGDAYDAGEVTLADFVTLRRDRRWGASYQPARSLDVARENAARRRGRVAA